ncbi:MAG TPA: ABC transporter substrate-binding protein [Mycobacteriales bacterium]|nr:ABC transporter substrate-binding protein [Mycobacteriales bacterium]
MNDFASTSRRTFLYGSALAAGAIALNACSSSSSGGGSGSGTSTGSGADDNSPTHAKVGGKAGSATKPIAAPKKFNESPALKGKRLPKVVDRLPKNPYVVPHNWLEKGKYGGTLNMIVFGTTGMANADSVREFFYGFSPLRLLNDGLTIGPGAADKWSSNRDATEWTVHFREGLKWSDGEPFTVDDVLFWWEDIILPGHFAQTPPDACRSANGKLATLKKVNDSTLRITLDAPQPIMDGHLASYAKGGTGKNGAIWILPKHYLKQFHPKYNKSVPKDWDTAGGLWAKKSDWMQNPDCPTLIGYKCKSYDNNKGVVLERNPYYYAVTQDGDQLPYIDEVAFNIVQDPQVAKLQVQQGKVDYCQGQFNQIGLADVSTLSKSKDQYGYEVLLWNTGSGTGSIFFLNYDYPEKKYRDLFRDKRFRQAISHAWDRTTAQKSLYFETGETTTGTMGPASIEFQVNKKGRSVYETWRDSYKKLDRAKAKSLLADIGLKDTNNDGYLEFPDGSKLTVEIPYSADISDPEAAKDDQLVSDAKKVGLRMVRRPVAAQAYGDQWTNGGLMSHTNWELSNGVNCLISPMWMVPIESSRWAPLEGAYFATIGTPQEHAEQNVDPWKRHPPRIAPEPGGPIAQLWKLYNQTKRETDAMKRNELVWKMMQIHIDEGPFFMGTIANFPNVIVAKTDLGNVPKKENLALGGLTNPWQMVSPGVYDPETWFWKSS